MRGRSPASVVCPGCGRVLSKVKKGWECTSSKCSVIRIRCGSPWAEPRRIERAARRREKPLSDEELKNLLVPFMTPSVLKQLRARERARAP